jgi:hypothetical protein
MFRGIFLGFAGINLYFCLPLKRKGEVPEWPKGTVC